jgi:Predicted metal-binding protein
MSDNRNIEIIQEIFNQSEVFQYGIINTTDINFAEEVRKLCEVNTCRQYGKTWVCPPAVGTVDECRIKCLKYDKMFVFTIKYDLEDSFDFEGMNKGMSDFKKVSRDLDIKIKPYLENYLMLSNEGCDICVECTYPDNPCRFPDIAHGSIEGYGIFVNELAKSAGVNYVNGANTVTYFGALLFNTIV